MQAFDNWLRYLFLSPIYTRTFFHVFFKFLIHMLPSHKRNHQHYRIGLCACHIRCTLLNNSASILGYCFSVIYQKNNSAHVSIITSREIEAVWKSFKSCTSFITAFDEVVVIMGLVFSIHRSISRNFCNENEHQQNYEIQGITALLWRRCQYCDKVQFEKYHFLYFAGEERGRGRWIFGSWQKSKICWRFTLNSFVSRSSSETGSIDKRTWFGDKDLSQ